MFGQTLTLNCDGNALMNFRGDLMNDNSYGKWKVLGDILEIRFDSITDIKQRYSGVDLYKIDNGKLTHFTISKEKYKSMINTLKNNGFADSLKLKKYRMFKNYSSFVKEMNQVMIDHKGTMRKQYLNRIKLIECN